MKEGKISDSVLKRTVLKSIGRLPEGLIRPAAGKDAAVLSSNAFGEKASGDFVVGTSVSSGNHIEKAIICSANNVAAAGYIPKGINLSIILPEECEEDKLRKFMERAYEVSKNLGTGIIGGHTEVIKTVKEPVFSVTAIGSEKIGRIVEENLVDSDIVMTGYAGYEGATEIYNMCEKEYNELFSHTYLRDIRQRIEEMSVIREAAVAGQHGVIAMHDVHNSGVFGALWELSEQIKSGFCVDVRSIPVKQETVEICERVDVNPYELTSMGALLIVTKDGKSLVEKLENEGFNGKVIGKVTSGKDKLLLNKEEKSFLNKPGIDEIYKIKNLKENEKLCVRNY